MVNFTPLGNGLGSLTSTMVSVKQRFDDTSIQLTTGQVAETYAGLGTQRGLSISSRARLAEIEGYKETINFATVQFELYDSTLGRLGDLSTEVKSGSDGNIYDVNSEGRTTGSVVADMAIREMMGLLNIDDGNSYLYSGRSTQQQPLANYDDIMYGSGIKAGFEEVLSERKFADIGGDTTLTYDGVTQTLKTGRLSVSNTATTLSLSEATNAFGFQIAGVQSTLDGQIQTYEPTEASFTAPDVAHDELTVDLGGNRPVAGDEFEFAFDLPDGTQTTITLVAADPLVEDIDATVGGTDADQSLIDIEAFSIIQTSDPGLQENGTIDFSTMADGDTITITDPNVNGGVAQTFTYQTTPTTDQEFNDVASLVTALSDYGLTAAADGGNVDLTGNQVGDTLTVAFSAGGSYTQDQAPVAFTPQIQSLSAATIAGFSEGETVTISDPNLLNGADQVFSYNPDADGSVPTEFSDLTSLVARLTDAGISAADFSGDLQVTALGGTDLSTSIAVVEEDIEDYAIFYVDQSGVEGTIENLKAALLEELDSYARTELAAASAVQAANDFFYSADDSEQAATRVVIPFGGSAEDALETETDAVNTVRWYVGDDSSTVDARDSMAATIDPNITLRYGARANEAAFAEQMRNFAVLSQERFSTDVDEDQDRYAALASRVRLNLVDVPGDQSIDQMQGEFAVQAAAIVKSEARLEISENTYTTFVQDIESVDRTEASARLLALETQLNVSYEATSMILSQSLLNYLR